ncbi:MAG: sigma-70 family RNA polymerase sigma factor [bacterium]
MSRNPFDIRLHLDALRRYARVLTRADQEADDLVQGALLRAYERRAGFREGGDLRVWLMSVLLNHFIDMTRSRRASEAREQAWAGLGPGFAAPEGEHAVRLAQLQRAVLALPADQREALHLMAVEGLSVAEAAAVLEIPAGTVMSRVGRARMALRLFEDGAAVAHRTPSLKLVRGRDDTSG